MSKKARDAFHGDCIKLRDQIAKAKREDRKVLYLDEICFTKRSVLMKDWSRANSNLSVDQKDVFTGYVTAIISMTEENGMGQYRIHQKAITSEQFIDYLKDLRSSFRKRGLAIVMDWLTVHYAAEVDPLYSELNIVPIWNVRYSPEFNPIEAVFSKVKAVYNARRLNAIVNKSNFDREETIKIALRSVTRDHCSACVRKSRHLLDKAIETS